MLSSKKIIAYWLKVAEHDYLTMLSLYRSKRYSDSLFFGHLVLEKILKALVVKKTGQHPRLTHNLLVLWQDSGVNLDKSEINFLAEVNKFNIKARYPDFKLAFYKVCNAQYAKPRLEKIKPLYYKLCLLAQD